MSKLPPLPEIQQLFTVEENIYTEDQMREYGQQCRKVALNEAAEACEELKSAYQDISESTLLTVSGKTVHQGMFGGAHNCAVAIRSLK
jgi:hypothetical protein